LVAHSSFIIPRSALTITMSHHTRLLNLSSPTDLAAEMARLGCEPAGIAIMAPKARGLLIRVEGVRGKAAAILKQLMLSVGGDVCVSREVAAFDDTPRPVLIIGDARHVGRVVKRLSGEPFGLRQIGAEIEQALQRWSATPPPVRCGGRELTFDRARVMGIINVTPDSFSGDGVMSVGAVTDRDAVAVGDRSHTSPSWVEGAIAQGVQFVAEGADLLDVGGESTRPGSEGVSVEEELRRVVPVIEGLAAQVGVPISIDSSKPEVCRAALAAGATIINDVCGLRQPGMLELAAETGAAVCVMHMQGEPRDMQHDPHYEDVVTEVYDFLAARIEAALAAGVAEEQIIVDPGFGFGKTAAHNLELVRRLREFRSLGRPVLLAASRKRTIGELTGKDAAARVFGTAALHAIGIANGANLVRVHDVAAMVDVARVAEALAGGGA
jgi:dihydropteroate synthase